MKTLDLHGVKHSDVQSMFDEFIYENMKLNTKEVEIITGISEQMKRIVRNLSDEYTMNCYEHPLNPGKLIIKLV
jgi:DNA-nicking Smr family endonuclease